VDTYVVRIYRRGGPPAAELIGVLEEAGTRRRAVFRTLDELWSFLACPGRAGRGGWPLGCPPERGWGLRAG
jgi:hypothetical protein